MALSYKDGISTVLAAATAGVLYVQAKGLDVSVLSSPRWSSAAVGVLGIALCISGSSSDQTVMKSNWGVSMGVVGGLAMLLAIIGLITNNKFYPESGAVLILAMWVLTTGRHLLA